MWQGYGRPQGLSWLGFRPEEARLAVTPNVTYVRYVPGPESLAEIDETRTPYTGDSRSTFCASMVTRAALVSTRAFHPVFMPDDVVRLLALLPIRRTKVARGP